MSARAMLAAAMTIGLCGAAAPPNTATIVNSGSTNSAGYTIVVSPDGKASVSVQPRSGVAATPKSFSIPQATATRFFDDLAAARKANIAAVPCMKSASFGSTTKVTWQGWTSPDLSCPAKDSTGDALTSDVDAIRQASGVGNP